MCSPCTSGTRKVGLRGKKLCWRVVKQVQASRHPWLIACDANMCPEDFGKELVVSKRATASKSCEATASRRGHEMSKSEKSEDQQGAFKVQFWNEREEDSA